MAMTNDAKNYMLDQRFGTGASSGSYLCLHSADPTTTVATANGNEIAGGSPAYARKQINFAAAATGSKALAASVVFDIQAGDSFGWYSISKTGTAGAGTQADFCGGNTLAAAEGAYGSQGTYTITALSISI